jgi:hypothetical protein
MPPLRIRFYWVTVTTNDVAPVALKVSIPNHPVSTSIWPAAQSGLAAFHTPVL